MAEIFFFFFFFFLCIFTTSFSGNINELHVNFQIESIELQMYIQLKETESDHVSLPDFL